MTGPAGGASHVEVKVFTQGNKYEKQERKRLWRGHPSEWLDVSAREAVEDDGDKRRDHGKRRTKDRKQMRKEG